VFSPRNFVFGSSKSHFNAYPHSGQRTSMEASTRALAVAEKVPGQFTNTTISRQLGGNLTNIEPSEVLVLRKSRGVTELPLLVCSRRLRQLPQHRIHVRLDGFELIFEELHVQQIKRCSLGYGCARLH